MPLMKCYRCNGCNRPFDYLHMSAGDAPTCPECASSDVAKVMSGGHTFQTIVATSLTSKKHKAGYVHNYVNRPAEKISVSVPKKVGG